MHKIIRTSMPTPDGMRQGKEDEDLCIRCGAEMVHIGFKIYRCRVCGHEEKPEDVI